VKITMYLEFSAATMAAAAGKDPAERCDQESIQTRSRSNYSACGRLVKRHVAALQLDQPLGATLAALLGELGA
jgi:hypothetical protein